MIHHPQTTSHYTAPIQNLWPNHISNTIYRPRPAFQTLGRNLTTHRNPLLYSSRNVRYHVHKPFRSCLRIYSFTISNRTPTNIFNAHTNSITPFSKPRYSLEGHRFLPTTSIASPSLRRPFSFHPYRTRRLLRSPLPPHFTSIPLPFPSPARIPPLQTPLTSPQQQHRP